MENKNIRVPTVTQIELIQLLEKHNSSFVIKAIKSHEKLLEALKGCANSIYIMEKRGEAPIGTHKTLMLTISEAEGGNHD